MVDTTKKNPPQKKNNPASRSAVNRHRTPWSLIKTGEEADYRSVLETHRCSSHDSWRLPIARSNTTSPPHGLVGKVNLLSRKLSEPVNMASHITYTRGRLSKLSTNGGGAHQLVSDKTCRFCLSGVEALAG